MGRNLAAFSVPLFATLSAAAQPFPAKTVRIIVPFTPGSILDTVARFAAGKLKVLAMVTANRYARLPEVPTLTEAVPAFEAPGSWLGFFGPANFTPAVLTRINNEFVRALTATDVKPKLEDAGMVVVANTPQQFAELIKKGFETYGRAVKIAGIKPE